MTKEDFRRGFTLLELLVVIGILTSLATLFLPALLRSRKAAQGVGCIEKIRQMGVSMSNYADDHAEFLPTAHDLVKWTSTNPLSWTRELLPYHKSTNAYACPAPRISPTRSAFNYFMGSRAAFVEAGGRAAPLQLSRVVYPSEYVLSGDSNFAFSEEDADPDNYTQDTLFGRSITLHNGRLNVLFADNHVSAFRCFEPSKMTYSYTCNGMNWDFP